MKWENFIALKERYHKLRGKPEDSELYVIFRFRDDREMITGPIAFWERGESLLVLDGYWLHSPERSTCVVTKWEEISSISFYDTWPFPEKGGVEPIGFKAERVL